MELFSPLRSVSIIDPHQECDIKTADINAKKNSVIFCFQLEFSAPKLIQLG
jgi:hypothetical protein